MIEFLRVNKKGRWFKNMAQIAIHLTQYLVKKVYGTCTAHGVHASFHGALYGQKAEAFRRQPLSLVAISCAGKFENII